MTLRLPQEPEFRIKWEAAQGRLGLGAENLQLALWLAVPLEINAIERNGGPHDYELEWIRGYIEELGSRGDDLQFGAKRKGETAVLFKNFAYALALLSFAPGGVQFAGMHFIGHRREEPTL